MQTLVVLRYLKKDLDEITRLVRENDSFVALVTGEIYNLENYLLPSELSNFTAIVDRNIYSRVTALVRGEKIPSHALGDHRWAAAIIAFCQIAKITFQYGSSLQEYASLRGGSSAVSDFECFHRADNCDPKAFIEFAVGRTDSLNLASIEKLPPPKEVPTAEKFEAPIFEFRINYILALKIARLSHEKASPHQLMLRFIDWMDKEFVLGAAALQFANLFFSPARMKGMLKKRSLDVIRNAAWDLALVASWSRDAVECAQRRQPILLVSRDKVVKFIAQRLVASAEEEFKGYLIDQWHPDRAKGEAVFERYMQVHQKIEKHPEQRHRPTDAELDSLTEELERQLIGIQCAR